MYVGIVEVDWVFTLISMCCYIASIQEMPVLAHRIKWSDWLILLVLSSKHYAKLYWTYRCQTKHSPIFNYGVRWQKNWECVSMHFLYSLCQILTLYKAKPLQRKTRSQDLICHYKQIHYNLQKNAAAPPAAVIWLNRWLVEEAPQSIVFQKSVRT